MLVLTRKHQEKIRIGDDIVITVLRTKGKAVRLGIEAPPTVPVIRGELAFENSADDESPASTEDASRSEARSTAVARRKPSHAPRDDANWSTDTSPQPTRNAREPEPQVALRRLPRNKVSDILPSLAAGVSPLRALLDERATSL
jgi:carbon storage regulator CsrA